MAYNPNQHYGDGARPPPVALYDPPVHSTYDDAPAHQAYDDAPAHAAYSDHAAYDGAPAHQAYNDAPAHQAYADAPARASYGAPDASRPPTHFSAAGPGGALPYDPFDAHAPAPVPYRDDPGTPRLSSAGGDYRASAASSSTPDVGLLAASYPPYRDSPLGSQPSFKPESARNSYGMPAPLPYEKPPAAPGKKKRVCPTWILVVVGVVLVAAAVVIPVYFTVIKKNGKSSASGAAGSGSGSGGGGGGSGSNSTGAGVLTSGGDGSTVTTDNGTTFTYTNPYGGFWVLDPSNPFNNSARANSWTPPLDTAWDWSKDKIFGVNLGGWFVLEPFITPALFQAYAGTVDEWTLSQALAADATPGGGFDVLRAHYETFITEEDIAQIAGAGLNWVRVPIPFWAMDTIPEEPFLAGEAWPHIVKMLGWCRKYGIRVNLDLHTVPGSQNGNNHSGRLGGIHWLNGTMGYANAQRTLDYIRTIAEFIAQPEYAPVVPYFSIVNEVVTRTVGVDIAMRFYLQAYDIIRNITGVGQGPLIAIHDGFQGTAPWADFLPGADRFSMDTHPYFAFSGAGTMAAAFLTGTGAAAGGVWPSRACGWGAGITTSKKQFGVTVAGEFSNGWNDCGLFLLGVGGDQYAQYPGNCTFWTDATQWGQDAIDGLTNFFTASIDALDNWFFWTWKIAPSQAGTVQIPLWSYKAGLDGGWIPRDPRSAAGACASFGVTLATFDGAFAPSQTGGGDGVVAATARAEFSWPPPLISGIPGDVPYAQIPAYAPGTATLTPLAMPTFTDAAGKAVSVSADGWKDGGDRPLKEVPVPDCVYPPAWSVGPTPTAVCSGGASATIGDVGGAAATPTPTARR